MTNQNVCTLTYHHCTVPCLIVWIERDCLHSIFFCTYLNVSLGSIFPFFNLLPCFHTLLIWWQITISLTFYQYTGKLISISIHVDLPSNLFFVSHMIKSLVNLDFQIFSVFSDSFSYDDKFNIWSSVKLVSHMIGAEVNFSSYQNSLETPQRRNETHGM